MRRKLIIGTVAVAVVVGGIAATTLSSAGAASVTVGAWGRGWMHAGHPGAAPNIGGAQTLTFRATTLKLRYVDADGDGKQDSGDYVIFSERLTNKSGTSLKGVDTVRCTFNTAGHGRDVTMCDGEFVVDGRGEIIVYGMANPWVAVTGGTGQFANVRGQASIDSVDADTEIITVYLTP